MNGDRLLVTMTVGEVRAVAAFELGVLPIEWVRALISSPEVPLPWRVRYVLAVTSGARDGEIHGARLCNADLSARPAPWRITSATAIVGADGFASQNRTKTRTSVRTLPLHPAAVDGIQEWLGSGWSLWTCRRPGANDYLFPGEDGAPTRPRSAETLRDHLALLGLPTTLHGAPIEFKSLRSTFATWLDEAGVDEHTRGRLMGHASRTVTERHYTARTMQRLFEAVATIQLAWPVTRSHVVTPVTTAKESAMVLAIPGRVELPTNGLGNRPNVTPRCGSGAHAACDCTPVSGSLIGCGIGERHEIVVGGHNGEAGHKAQSWLGDARAHLAAEAAWWDAADAPGPLEEGWAS